jgi:hypothetical protein
MKKGAEKVKKYNYMIIAFVAALLIVSAGCDRDRRGKEPAYPGKDKDSGYVGNLDKLNLTTDQKSKLIDLQEKLFTGNEEITDGIVKKGFELKKLYLADNPDINAIDKVQDDIKALADKRIPLFREYRDTARALLTEEQLKADPYAFIGPGEGMGPGCFSAFGPGPGTMGPHFGDKFRCDGERGKWGHEREGRHHWWGDDDK